MIAKTNHTAAAGLAAMLMAYAAKGYGDPSAAIIDRGDENKPKVEASVESNAETKTPEVRPEGSDEKDRHDPYETSDDISIAYSYGVYDEPGWHGGIGRYRHRLADTRYHIAAGLGIFVNPGLEDAHGEHPLLVHPQLGAGITFDVSKDARIGMTAYPLSFAFVSGPKGDDRPSDLKTENTVWYIPSAGLEGEIGLGTNLVTLYDFPNAGMIIEDGPEPYLGLEFGIRGHF
ncbi:MAG: hypothetical protein ACE5DM_00875 [Candidatus Nanoarchaeia archaeon]